MKGVFILHLCPLILRGNNEIIDFSIKFILLWLCWDWEIWYLTYTVLFDDMILIFLVFCRHILRCRTHNNLSDDRRNHLFSGISLLYLQTLVDRNTRFFSTTDILFDYFLLFSSILLSISVNNISAVSI